MNRTILRCAPLIALALAACGGGGDKNAQALNDLDKSLAGNQADPALAASLEDQIMVDPSLSAQANRDAIRPPGEPARAPIPNTGPGTAPSAAELGTLRSAPAAIAMDAADSPATLGALAQAQKGGNCGAGDMNYSAAWAAKLPADMPIYPKARVTEAAGKDVNGCSLRAVSFTTATPVQGVLDYYFTRATAAGFAAEHRASGDEHMLGGTRAAGDAAFVVIAKPAQGGGTEVDLIANNGR